MFRELYDAMRDHALAAYPDPACGAVFADGPGHVYRVIEDALRPSRDDFDLGPAVLRRLRTAPAPLAAIVLTHPQPEGVEHVPLLHTPSAAEMRAQEALVVPFGVAVFHPRARFQTFWFGDQCPIPPLVGRPFRHGVTDCYSVIRDWFRLRRGIVLPNFPRDWNWWIDGFDLYRTGFEQAGFEPIDPGDIREGDGVLFQFRSSVSNHAAVVLDEEWMLHHPGAFKPFDVSKASHEQRIDRWRRYATHWLRHGGTATGSGE